MGGLPPPRYLGGGYPPLGMPPPPGARGRGMPGGQGGPPVPPGGRRGGMIARGGQLEIAGVVVGSWGANYGQGPRGAQGPPPRGLRTPSHLPPQVTSVGGRWVLPPSLCRNDGWSTRLISSSVSRYWK